MSYTPQGLGHLVMRVRDLERSHLGFGLGMSYTPQGWAIWSCGYATWNGLWTSTPA